MLELGNAWKTGARAEIEPPQPTLTCVEDRSPDDHRRRIDSHAGSCRRRLPVIGALLVVKHNRSSDDLTTEPADPEDRATRKRFANGLEQANVSLGTGFAPSGLRFPITLEIAFPRIRCGRYLDTQPLPLRRPDVA